MTDRLVLSVAEVAEALGVSDDLVHELTEQGKTGAPGMNVGLWPRSLVWQHVGDRPHREHDQRQSGS